MDASSAGLAACIIGALGTYPAIQAGKPGLTLIGLVGL